MTEQKAVAVLIPGAGGETALREVTIEEGSTAQDVLNKLGKGVGFNLGTASGKLFSNPKELVFSAIGEEDKLALTPRADAGAIIKAPAFFKTLSQKIFEVRSTAGASPRFPAARDEVKSNTLVVKASQPIIVKPTRPIVVAPSIQPVWKEKGWREVSSKVWQGDFLSLYRGRVEFGPLGFQHVYIWGPPKKPKEIWLNNHPKNICFSSLDRNSGKYEVHMHDKPDSVDCAIVNIERILQEAGVGGKHAQWK